MIPIIILLTLFMIAIGGMLGFIRGETFPGTLGTTQGWLFQESTDGRFTLHRWAMVVTAGLMQAIFAAVLPGLAWWMPITVWALTGAAWAMPHSPFIPNNPFMVSLSGLAMTLTPAIVLLIAGYPTLMGVAIVAGASKQVVYDVCEKVVPDGLSFPWWWTVIAEIVNGMLEIGVPIALFTWALAWTAA